MTSILTVLTPPNSIIFASNRVKISDMIKAGFVLNMMSIILVSILIYLLGNILFDFSIFPEWARIK